MAIVYKQMQSIKGILRFIMQDRGWTKEQMLAFVRNEPIFHSSYLLTNIDKAVNVILKHLQKRNHITIIGDYDVDGICSTAILYMTLNAVNPNVHYLIPDRFTDGYGMNNNLIDKAYDLHTSLIVTVDNGIKSHNEVQYAQSKGMEVIITDHHAFEDDTLPCDITVNPQIDDNYPFKGICGCMVTYKLCLLLINEFDKFADVNVNVTELAELTTLATIADIMPLIDENRWFVRHYLQNMHNTSNIGLKALLNALYIKQVTEMDVGFYIAPCLNAAGRMENANVAIDLLLCDDEKEAIEKAKYLKALNDKRKELQKEIIQDIKVDTSHNVIFCSIKNKNAGGILGIIAAQIANKYHKPTFVLSEHNNIYSGSGRSVNDYALNRVIECNKYVSGGGHKGACGIAFNVNDLDRLQQFADDDYTQYINTLPEVNVTKMQINFDIIQDKLIEDLNKLKPFSIGNEQPVFHTENITVVSSKVVGKNQNVTQLELKQNNIVLRGVIFQGIEKPVIHSIDYTLDFNEYNGYKNIQLTIVDFR